MPRRKQQKTSKKVFKDKEGFVRFRALEVKDGIVVHEHRIADEPGEKSRYYHMKDITLGPKNAQRKIRVHFQSLEAEENEELLHLLHENMRT